MAPTVVATDTNPAAAVVDAALRNHAPVRVAHAGLRPITNEMRVSGEVVAVRHYGSVDVFLEAFESAKPGQVLVIDNDGRLDEGCIGDLTGLEAAAAHMAGIIVWGAHRDTQELARIGLPVFSYGCVPAGPRSARVRPSDAIGHARFGDFSLRSGDWVVADADGAAFLEGADVPRVLKAAREIATRERGQADRIRAGTSLRTQLRFREYLEARKNDATLSFRDHLRRLGGEIEQ